MDKDLPSAWGTWNRRVEGVCRFADTCGEGKASPRFPAEFREPLIVNLRAGPRSPLEKFAAVQMVDVHIPTSDGRTLILSRYTQPERDLQLLLARLKLELPAQPPPRITGGPGAADVAL